MSTGTLRVRVEALESRAEDTDVVLETLTNKVNEVRVDTATILKNLAALMTAHGVPIAGLTDDETDEPFD